MIGSVIRFLESDRQGRKLQKKADALNPVRPEYNIPGQIRTIEESAQAMAQGDAPGYGRMKSEAEGAGTRFVGQSRNMADSGAGLLQAASQADLNTRRNLGDINVQNQQFRASQMSAFQRALAQSAQFEDQAFNVNEMQPYLQEESDKRQFEQAAMNQKQASTDALASGIDGVTNMAMSMLGSPTGATGSSTFTKLFGGGGEASVKSPLEEDGFYIPPYRSNIG